jgi:hypothetical protein
MIDLHTVVEPFAKAKGRVSVKGEQFGCGEETDSIGAGGPFCGV